MRWTRPISWAALAAVTPGQINCYWRVLPVGEPTSWAQAREISAWYQSSPLRKQFPILLTNHPGIYFYMDINPADSHRIQAWLPKNFHHPAPGVLLLWDPIFAVFNSNPVQTYPYDRVIADGWVEDFKSEFQADVEDSDSPDPTKNWHIFRGKIQSP
jgi:hypothetical protein